MRFVLHNQSRRTTSSISKNESRDRIYVFRCDLHERATRLTRDIQRASEIFEEEKMTYIPPEEESVNDDDDDDGNDGVIPEEGQIDELVKPT